MLKAFSDGRLFGSRHGSGIPDVVALHGWGRTQRDFDRVLSGHDGIALDLPGFGSSPPPSEPWGSPEYAAAVAPILAEVARRPVVLGHSFGGRVAIHLAARWPDAVGALVLTGVPLQGSSGRRRSPVPYRIARALHRTGLVSATRMNALRYRYGSPDYRAAQGVMREVLIQVLGERYEEPLAAISCPIHFVWGDNDSAAPLDVAEAVTARLPNASLTVCPGAGHLLPLTEPEALWAAVERQRASADPSRHPARHGSSDQTPDQSSNR